MFRRQLKTYFFFEILTRCTQRTRDILIMHYINLHFTYLPTYLQKCVCVCVSAYKASELVSVKSKADEVVSQKAALDDHIATLKVTNSR